MLALAAVSEALIEQQIKLLFEMLIALAGRRELVLEVLDIGANVGVDVLDSTRAPSTPGMLPNHQFDVKCYAGIT